MSVLRINRNRCFSFAFLIGVFWGSSEALADEETPDPEGGIGIGHFGRLSAQVSRVDVAPGRSESGVLEGNVYESSNAIKLAADFSALVLPSVNNNLHGFEGSISVALFPFDFDVWGGTALTMLSLGRGGVGTIRIRGGFGVGMSYLHSYAYLKAQAAAVIVPNKVAVEASVFWIPNQVSIAWGEIEGDFEEQRRRAAVFTSLGGEAKRKIEVYIEHIDRKRGGHDAAFTGAREDFSTRNPDDDMNGFGVGVSLMLTFDD